MHRRQYIFSNINENEISETEAPSNKYHQNPQYGTELLSISSISIIWSRKSILRGTSLYELGVPVNISKIMFLCSAVRHIPNIS